GIGVVRVFRETPFDPAHDLRGRQRRIVQKDVAATGRFDRRQYCVPVHAGDAGSDKRLGELLADHVRDHAAAAEKLESGNAVGDVATDDLVAEIVAVEAAARGDDRPV